MTRFNITQRKGERPNTKKIEFGHDQLEKHSPTGYRERIIEEISKLQCVTTGRSQVSEPASIGFHLANGKGPKDAFLYQGTIEFAHIHTTGFLHISMPHSFVQPIIENGWGEIHPVTKRPEFYDNILMLYAPTTEEELKFVIELIKISYHFALGDKELE